ncbi:MAG: hypothetical protein FWD62_15270, partial [Betaproteobacteria bacterium]|nr:hypothetical protein [Betaproteobacteria bacterium]
ASNRKTDQRKLTTDLSSCRPRCNVAAAEKRDFNNPYNFRQQLSFSPYPLSDFMPSFQIGDLK